MIKGYSEYHASQVELLKLLGAESIEVPIAFTLNQSFETYAGRRTALEYISKSHNTAINIIERPDSPDSFETLSVGLGMAFNHLGRLSICNMYAIDYAEHSELIEDTSVEKRVFGDDYAALESILIGFPEKRDVIRTGPLFLNLVIKMSAKI